MLPSSLSRGTKLSWRLFALAPLVLSGCALPPVQVTCVIPTPPPELMAPAPPPGSFQDRLDRILEQTSTNSPATPTK